MNFMQNYALKKRTKPKLYKQMEKELRTVKLMHTYNKFKSQQEKDWWVSSLRLEDKALVRKALNKNPNKLF